MANYDPNKVVRKVHPAARAAYAVMFFFVIGLPLSLVGLWRLDIILKGREAGVGADGTAQAASGLPWFVWLIVIFVFFIPPIWVKLKAMLATRFIVTLNSVISEHGMVSRRTSEVRIQDIRNVRVEQSVFDRLASVGDVVFSSAAGDADEVRFNRIGKPHVMRELVNEIRESTRDNFLDDDERQRLGLASDGSAASKPASKRGAAAAAAKASSAGSDGDRDELYRLLADQRTSDD